MKSRDIARGLAWFGIGLGLGELLAPRAVARATGLEGHETLLRIFGAREIASGIVVLAAENPEAWLWMRVAGDVLDGLLLSAGMTADNPNRHRTLLATAVVAPVVALDALHARRSLGRETAEYTPVPERQPILPTSTFVRYTDAVERIPSDEAKTIEAILASTHRLYERNYAKLGEAVRVSHAKAHGLAVGEITVAEDLPEPLAQGVFKPGARYPVIARLANVPGELDSDAVATQRGMALKLFGVEGDMLPGHTGATQDFVLDSGNRFAAGTAAQFLVNHRLLEHAPQIPAAVKAAVSTASRVGNKTLHRFGADSPTLDFFGLSRVHPMAEAYFTQAPIRYGDYLAKLAVVPVAPAQRALDGTAVDLDDPNALRTATVGYLRDHDAEFEVRVQLCTDLDTMPVEDASVEWPEEQSPYRTVARLRLPKQEAYSSARRGFVDALSFCVSHSLSAHRPLGSIMRARLRAYLSCPACAVRRTASRSASQPRSMKCRHRRSAYRLGSAIDGEPAPSEDVTAGQSRPALGGHAAALGPSPHPSTRPTMTETRPLAVVTGASSGIGYELALVCARNGYDLVVAADEAQIHASAEAFRKAGAAFVEAVEADLSTTQGNDELLAAIGRSGRPVEALFANAGRGLGKGFLDQNFDDVRRVVDTNVTGTLYLLHRVVGQMRGRKAGRVLITGSIAGYLPGSFQAVYNATKAFLNSFAFALREEVEEDGITVTVLEPGATETEFFERADMMDTKVGTARKDDPAMVAQVGFDAMMRGDGDVVSGLKNKLQTVMASVTPSGMLSAQHRKMAEPGTADR